MKQGLLAERLGVSQGRLSQWENGLHDPQPTSLVLEIANILETDVDYLLHGTPPSPRRVRAAETGRVKIYGSVSAGDGDNSPYDPDELDVPIEMARPDFGALVVHGESMAPFLFPGDTVIFRDYQGDKPNITWAAHLPDGRWVVKFLGRVDGDYKLLSANPDYEPIDGPFTLAGYLVGIVRDTGPEREMRLNPLGLQPKPYEMGALARFLKF